MEHDGKLYEQVYDPKNGTRFCVWDGTAFGFVPSVAVNGAEIWPVQDMEALEKGVVLLPEKPVEYGTTPDLIKAIQEHIHRWVDVSPEFEMIAVYSIPFYWLYDRFNNLHYLRALGDTGTGKSRVLDSIGRLAYKPTMIAGALTTAPIFRLAEKWHGSLIIDEADLKDSSAVSDIVTILNCGFERNRPVIRCNKDDPGKIETFDVFGPKVLATRLSFQDKALEARCMTEQMEETNRTDIPDNINDSFYEEERILRNKLLMFRFRNYASTTPQSSEGIILYSVEPRLRQISRGVLATLGDEETIKGFVSYIEALNSRIREERATTKEGMVINTLMELHDAGELDITPSRISEQMKETYKLGEKEALTAAKVGMRLKNLKVKTELKRQEGKKPARFVVWEDGLMKKLRRRYFVTSVTTVTDVTGEPQRALTFFSDDQNQPPNKKCLGEGHRTLDTTVTVVTAVTKQPSFPLEKEENALSPVEIEDAITTFILSQENCVQWKDIFIHLQETVKECEIEKALARLMTVGLIYEPTPGMVRMV